LHKQAIDYFKKCLVLVKTEDRRAGLFNNLGICYKNLNRPDEAEKNYLLAFATFEQLAKDNPAQFEPDLAKTANNLGNFYTIHHRPDEAEKNYLRAFEIYKRLAEKHPEQFKPVWASVANNF